MAVISVVIPALNDAEMLARCLAALARQTRPADEIVVVDNGSTDNTADVALSAGARVVNEPRQGIPAATAAGFDAAKGSIIARLDADSVPHEDWLARLESRFAARPQMAALTGPGEFYGANRVVRWLGQTVYIGGYFWSMGWLLAHPPLFGSNFAIRASAWERIRETSHRDVRELHDDLDLSFQFKPGMQIVFDRHLRVGVSSRPFGSIAGLRRRLYWAYTTIAVNARQQPLLERRADHRAWQRAHELDAFPAEVFGADGFGTESFGPDEFGPELNPRG
jgi:glycosyltransferase involved in cell wall biosynthesis